VHLPWTKRAVEHVRGLWAWLSRRPRYAPFAPDRGIQSLKSGYLLVDFIEKDQGTLLSSMWPPDTITQKHNFYRSLSQVMLDLARRPLEKIGSFTVHDSGEISLSNRPLTLRIPLLGSEGIPTNIPRDRCYSTVDSYLHDLRNCLDLKLKHQPNSVRDRSDAEGQMAVLTTLRALLPDLIQGDLRHGPFIYTLTDLQPSNMFVDQQYSITSIVDIEWCCSLPVEAQHPPFWLSGHMVDDLQGEEEKAFDDMWEEFLTIFEQEDKKHSILGSGFCSKVMRIAHRKKSHWLWASLKEPRAMNDIILDHLQPQFAPTLSAEEAIRFQQVMARLWCRDADDFIQQKLDDRHSYVEQLRSTYRDQVPSTL
jgi:hypothetical protein